MNWQHAAAWIWGWAGEERNNGVWVTHSLPCTRSHVIHPRTLGLARSCLPVSSCWPDLFTAKVYIYCHRHTLAHTTHRRTCTGASCGGLGGGGGVFRESSAPNPNIVNWGQVCFLPRLLSFLSYRLLVTSRWYRRALPWCKSTAGSRYVTYVWLMARINRYFKSQPSLVS